MSNLQNDDPQLLKTAPSYQMVTQVFIHEPIGPFSIKTLTLSNLTLMVQYQNEDHFFLANFQYDREEFQETSHIWKFTLVYCVPLTLPGNMGL